MASNTLRYQFIVHARQQQVAPDIARSGLIKINDFVTCVF
jgi:hypothetical protein